ncbi:MAG: prepilin-type N-terminal cleavage/methylation domain-containing protein [Gammaproteobacteria bacterium]
MLFRNKMQRNRGFTLLEIITTVVVIAVAATALMSVFSSTVATSADPVLEHQAIAVAEAYMEEISLKDFDQSGPLAPPRAEYNDVRDYNNLPDAVVRDQNGVAIGSLSDYSITVTVVPDSLNAIPMVDSLRIDITVSHASIDPVLLSGYRTDY